MISVIFLGGGQGAGKTTGADFIRESLMYDPIAPPEVITLKWADTLYELHHQIEHRLRPILGQEPMKKNGPLLQILGTEIGRNLFDKNIWVKDVHQKIKRTRESYGDENIVFIIEDTRFFNEIELQDTLKAEGYRTVSIYFEASLDVRKDRTEGFRENTGHQSEVEAQQIKDKFDHLILTDGDISKKNEAIKEALDQSGIKLDPRASLSECATVFTEMLRRWESATGLGANFKWQYNQRGQKELIVDDVAPLCPLNKTEAEEKIAKVSEVMESISEYQVQKS